jgi:hypothetical protein
VVSGRRCTSRCLENVSRVDALSSKQRVVGSSPADDRLNRHPALKDQLTLYFAWALVRVAHRLTATRRICTRFVLKLKSQPVAG